MEILTKVVTEKNNASLTFRAEAQEYAPYLQQAAEELQQKQPIGGFRAGKAPLAICEKTYGPALFELANRQAVLPLFAMACRQAELAPVSKPVFHILEQSLQGLTLAADFANYPTVKDVPYRGLKVTRYIKTCTEAEVDAQVDRYMDNHLWVHEVAREARMDDIVEVDYSGTCGGESFPLDHGDSRFRLGTGQLFAGLDAQLVGHSAGDELALTLTMPENFHRPEIAGRTLDLRVTLKSVWARDRLECTDDYVREQVKIPGCDTVADLREHLRRKLQEHYDHRSSELYGVELRKAMAAAVTCEIPEAMLEVAIRRFRNTLEMVASGSNQTAEEALAAEGKTMEQFLTESRALAERQVKASLLLDYIARQENLTVTPQELDTLVQQRAAESGKSVEELRRNEDLLEQFCEDILNEKAFELVRRTSAPQLVEVDAFPNE